MKRTILAVSLAVFAATALAAAPRNDQYRNNAGEQDRHQPQVALSDSPSTDENGGTYFPQPPQLG